MYGRQTECAIAAVSRLAEIYDEGRTLLSANEIARFEQKFFPEIDNMVLAWTIEAYQRLGCWEGDVQISQEVFENTLDVFEFSGDLIRRIDWQAVACEPPG